jgi:hypothetical protein
MELEEEAEKHMKKIMHPIIMAMLGGAVQRGLLWDEGEEQGGGIRDQGGGIKEEGSRRRRDQGGGDQGEG